MKLQTRENLKTQLETSKIKPTKSSLFTLKSFSKKFYLSQNLEINKLSTIRIIYAEYKSLRNRFQVNIISIWNQTISLKNVKQEASEQELKSVNIYAMSLFNL